MLRLAHGRLAGVVVLLLLSTLALAPTTSAAALHWTAPMLLRETRQGLGIVDADFDGANVAVLWQETRARPPHMTLKTSVNGGRSFAPGVRFAGAKSAAVDLCGDQVALAYTQPAGLHGWQISLARGRAGNADFTRTAITTTRREVTRVDVACLPGRVFVSWLQDAASGYRLYVASVLLSDGSVGMTYDLGIDRTDYPRGLRLAAAGDHVYALYGLTGEPRLQLRRWDVLHASDYPVTALPLQYVTKRSNCAAEAPAMGADGDRVVIAWSRSASVVTRVSTDAGTTWGPTVGWDRCPGPNEHVDGVVAPKLIAVSGQRIALMYSIGVIFAGTWEIVMLTRDDFRSFTEEEISAGARHDHHVGFITVGDRVRLADAFGVWGRWIGYRRQK